MQAPTIPATQFLPEVARERKPLTYYLEKWFPRLLKYSQKSGGAELPFDELRHKVVDSARNVYVERARKYGCASTRALDEQDETARLLVNAWSYHWALREAFLRQSAERKGTSWNCQDDPNLDETTIKELKNGRTFKARGKEDYSNLVPHELGDDPLEDLVFVDLCYVEQNVFATKFRERFGGYFRTLFENSSLPQDALSPEEITSCIDQVFMQTIKRTFLGLAALRHWCGRCFLNVCKRVVDDNKPIAPVSIDSKGDDDESEGRAFEPSVDFDCTDEDREIVDKYVSTFQEGFFNLPTALQLALDFRFTHVWNQGQGRRITRIADLSEGELAAAGNVMGLSKADMGKLFQQNKTKIVNLFNFQKRALEEDLSPLGLLALVGAISQIVASKAKLSQV